MTKNTLRISVDTPLQPLVLLVDADLKRLARWTVLLAESDYGVVTAKAPGEILELQCLGGVQIAIFSGWMEMGALRASAESVRRQWPTARILILGEVTSALEDYLYDERMDPVFDTKRLLDTLKRLKKEAWERQSLSPEWHLSGDVFVNWGHSNRRLRPQESDPKKDMCSGAPMPHSRMRPILPPERRR